MRIKFLLVFLLGTVALRAQTIEVAGLQSGVWDADTVMVTDDVVVTDNLSILPGTNVVFDGYYSILVEENASFTAIGTMNDSIVFTVIDTTGFHVFDLQQGGWNGIRINQAQTAQFDYCKFQYGKAASDESQDGGALRIYNCMDVQISNSYLCHNFSREHGGALYAELSRIEMHGCKVNNNLLYSGVDTIYYMCGGAMHLIKCEAVLTDMKFCRNYGEISIGGALCADSSSLVLDRALFEGNYGINGGGMYLIDCNGKDCSISNCLFTGNTSGHFGGGLAMRNTSPEISNITVTDNLSIGVNCGGIFFYQDSHPVLRNCIVWGNHCNNESNIQMWFWIYDNIEAPSLYNCLIMGGLEYISGFEYIGINENLMKDDPLFVDADNHDFHLSAESPCIDAGSPDTNPSVLAGYDLDGVWRVYGAAIDLGAYEYSGVNLPETAPAETTLHVVGNPLTADSYLELQLNQSGKVEVMVYSLNGTLLRYQDYGTLQSGLQRLALGGLAEQMAHGVYLIEIMTEEGLKSAKVVK